MLPALAIFCHLTDYLQMYRIKVIHAILHFLESGNRTWHIWVFCFTVSHKTAIKVSSMSGFDWGRICFQVDSHNYWQNSASHCLRQAVGQRSASFLPHGNLLLQSQQETAEKMEITILCDLIIKNDNCPVLPYSPGQKQVIQRERITHSYNYWEVGLFGNILEGLPVPNSPASKQQR